MNSAKLLKVALEKAEKAREAAIAASEALLAYEMSTVKEAPLPAANPEPAKPSNRTTHHQKILWALGTYGPLTRAQVYYYSGISPTSSASNTAYADLIEDGLIANANKELTITGDGIGVVQHLLTGAPNPFHIFEEFCNRQSKHLQKILRWHYKERGRTYMRSSLCELSEVSPTSSSTNTAIARLVNLRIAEAGRGLVNFENWYLHAIQPTVRVFDGKTGATTRHDVVKGKPIG